jgi:MFS transporter, PPP family, 3-phenylpropionic acid transporter
VNSNAWRLGAGYFTYFGAVGIFVPFWSPYLALHGFSALEIGLLVSLMAAARSIGPLGLGWLADVSRRPTVVLRVAAGLAMVTFALLPLQSHLAGFACLTLLFGVFWNAVIPLYDAHALSHLDNAAAHYGRLRLWGSVGFIVVAWAAGLVFDRVGYLQVPPLMFFLIAATFLVMLTIDPMQIRSLPVRPRQLGSSLRSRTVLISLMTSALVVMSFAPYYVFFSIWLEQYHYSKAAIGALWALGVIAEIGIFFIGPTLLSRFSIRTLFIAAAAGTAVRWIAVAWLVHHPWLLALSQLLHCLGFAVLHFAMVLTAQREFPDELANIGQSVFSSVAYGAGGLIGSLLAGVIWTTISPRASYVGAAFIVVLAAICAAQGLRGTPLDRVSTMTA